MSQDPKTLSERLQAKIAECKSLREKLDTPGTNSDPNADLTAYKTALGEANALRETLVSLKAADDEMKALHAFENTPAPKVPLPTGEGGVKTPGMEHVGEPKPAGKTVINVMDVKSMLAETVETGPGLIDIKTWNHILTDDYKSAFWALVKARGDQRILSASHVKALQEGLDSEGGNWIPPDFVVALIQRKPTPLSVSGLVREWNTGRDRMIFPKVVYTGATDDSNAILYTTGVRTFYAGEIPPSSTSVNATDPTPGQLEIPVFTLMASLPVTHNMLEDSPVQIQAFLVDKLGEANELVEDRDILIGNGSGRPMGILGSVSANAYDANSPQYVQTANAATIAADDLVGITHDLAPQYLDNVRFVMNWTRTAQIVDLLKDGNGRYLFRNGVMDDGLEQPRNRERTLLGYNTAYSEFMPGSNPAVSGENSVIFGDLRAYWKVRRLGMSMQILDQTLAKQNQIEILVRRRWGGAPAEPWRLKALQTT